MLIPESFRMILCNPEIERDIGEENVKIKEDTTKNQFELYFRNRLQPILYDKEGNKVSQDRINKEKIQKQMKDFLSIGVESARKSEKAEEYEIQIVEKRYIDFEFRNLRIVVTIPIVEKILGFVNKITKIQKRKEEARLEHRMEEVKQILLNSESSSYARDESSEEAISPKKGPSKNPKGSAASAQTPKNKKPKTESSKKEEDKAQGKATEAKKAILQKVFMTKGTMDEAEKKPKQKLPKRYDKEVRMEVQGTIDNIETWVPLDARNEKSRVLSLSFCTDVSYKQDQYYKHLKDENSKKVTQEILAMSCEDATVLVNHLTMLMYNRHLQEVQEELTQEKLLLPTRISLMYDKLVKTSKDLEIMNLELIVEPIDLKVGFREIDNFKDIQKLVEDMQEQLNQEEKEEDENYKAAEKFMTRLSQEELPQASQDILRKFKYGLDENTEPKVKKKYFQNPFMKQIRKMGVKVFVDSINACLMDDTGMNEYPLANINIHSITAMLEIDDSKDDVWTFIIKKLGIPKNPHMKIQANLSLEAYYFNLDSGVYEPVIEPWFLEANLQKIRPKSTMKINVNSPKMLNINLTYGMTLVIKRLLTKIGQSNKDWEDEERIEKLKTYKQKPLTVKRLFNKKLMKEDSSSMLAAEQPGPVSPSNEEIDESSSGFIIENNLGIDLKVTIENFKIWEKDIKFSRKLKDTAQIDFAKIGNQGKSVFRSINDMHAVNRYVRKHQGKNKPIKEIEDAILRLDLYIEDMQPIEGVPIEIPGLRTYELIPKAETEKAYKKHKHHYMLVVDVIQEGTNKLVSFESQIAIENNTEYDMEIGGLSKRANVNKLEEMDEDTLIRLNENDEARPKQNYGLASYINFERIAAIDVVKSGAKYKVPIKWVLEETSIFYRCTVEDSPYYKLLLPNLKDTYLQKTKHKKPYENLPKYHLLKKNDYVDVFFAVDTKVIKSKPTALNQPPQYVCQIRPPVCINNMMFGTLKIVRVADKKLIHEIKTGESAYMYEGPQNKINSHENTKKDYWGKRKEDSKELAVDQDYLQLNKYVFSFEEDDNVLYQTKPIYIISENKKVDFLCKYRKDSKSEEVELKITLNYDAINFDVFLYSPYTIVNKTGHIIYFGEKANKKVDLECLYPHRNILFNPTSSKKKKFSLKVKNYEWSKPFDITTFGITGEVSLKRSKNKPRSNYNGDDADEEDIICKYNANVLNLGVIISTLSHPYGKTTSVTLVPRYVFVNSTKIPLILSQACDNATKQFLIKPDGMLTYHFEYKDEENSWVKFREAKPEENDNTKIYPLDKFPITHWSSRFGIDSNEDFQISVKASRGIVNSEDTLMKNVTEIDPSTGQEVEIEQHLEDTKWNKPSSLNDYRRFIRVIITTKDQATLFIMLCEPNMPEFSIRNYVPREIVCYQAGSKDTRIENICSPAKIHEYYDAKGLVTKYETYPIPFVWDDQCAKVKKVIIEIDGAKKEYDITELGDKPNFEAKHKKYYVKVISTGYFRELEIKDRKHEAEKEKEQIFRNLLLAAGHTIDSFRMHIELEGLGVSLVDKEPKEIIYLSVYKIKAQATKEAQYIDDGTLETQEEYDLKVYHIQIDNMVSKENAIIFAPVESLDRYTIENDPDYTPFIQLKISYASNEFSAMSRTKIEALQLVIQAMKVEVETGTIKIILHNVNEVSEVFKENQPTDGNQEGLASQKHVGMNKLTRDELINGPNPEDANKEEERKSLDEEGDQLMEPFKKHNNCDEINPCLPEPPELSAVNTDKLYFKFIQLGAIKINLTLKFEKKTLKFDTNQGFGALTILYSLGTSIASISDAPLKFKMLVVSDVFRSKDSMIDSIKHNFIRQAVFQFYKIIGSSDLIGNPVGFVDKLGSGVYEFFSEPTKGLVKGPREFVGGVGKGVKALTTGVVSAGFDSASKISGSCYSFVKSVTGQDIQYQKKSENVFEGFYDGVVGGSKEVVYGVTGVVTKPYAGARRDGPRGFAKGVGTGICGLTFAPLTGMLKC